MRDLYTIIILASILILLCCEESANWPINADETAKLVVDANLTDESKRQSIRLSLSTNSLQEEVVAVSDAVISVRSGITVYPFLFDLNSSQYLSIDSFAVQGNLEYDLEIKWREHTYSARSELATVAPIGDIAFRTFGNTDSLVIRDIIPSYLANEQAWHDLQIDWSHLNEEPPNRAQTYYFTFSQLHISQFIQPNIDRPRFPSGSLVYVRKYGLSEAHAAFLRASQIETEWNGSFFYPHPENLPGNISNGALGFFSTSAVLTDTLLAL